MRHMSNLEERRARAAADVADGYVLATVGVAAAPERVFHALTSTEITRWWVRPGVFTTTEWTGDVRAGGRWRAAGVALGRPWALEGEFVRIDAPRALVHTWRDPAAPHGMTTVTYRLEPGNGGGTQVTLRHAGFTARDVCVSTCIGWETSFERLAELLGGPG